MPTVKTHHETQPGGPATHADARLANAAWETLMRTHAVMMTHFATDHGWEPLNLTEYDVLYALEKSGCSLRATDLVHEVFLSQPTLSRTVDRLVERGYIARSQDHTDRRASLLTLTDSGRAARAEVGAKHALAITRRLAGTLSRDELETLSTLLTRILEANPR